MLGTVSLSEDIWFIFKWLFNLKLGVNLIRECLASHQGDVGPQISRLYCSILVKVVYGKQ